MKIHVEVTQNHISQGSPRSPWSCPLALALHDAVSGIPELQALDVRMGSYSGGFYTQGIFKHYFTLPDAGQGLIWKVDAGLNAKPVNFDLEIFASPANPKPVERKLVDLKMWSDPGWDDVRRNAKLAEDAQKK